MVKNNIARSFLIIILFVVVFAVKPVDAQQSRDRRSNSCGTAGLKCCELSFGSVLEKQSAEATGVVPDVVKGIIEKVFGYVFPVFDSAPPMQELSKLKCITGVPKQVGTTCTCTIEPEERLKASLATVCKRNISGKAVLETNPDLKKQLLLEDAACKKCAVEEKGYYSSIGCIPSDLGEFISNFVLRIGIGIAGFISMLCIIYSAFLMQMSQGNPETVQKARDQITSCLIGLMMIIFSVFILRLIGVDILRIPGFA